MNKFLNFYIKRPLLWDIIISGSLVYFVNKVLSHFSLIFPFDLESCKSVLTDLISSSISLAGFVLASLTIIVTFKDNISHKEFTTKELADPEKARPLDLLFSSKHYKRIVGVFTWATLIFILVFFSSALLKMVIGYLGPHYYLPVSVFGISITTLTVLRSLLVLYNIIRLQVVGGTT